MAILKKYCTDLPLQFYMGTSSHWFAPAWLVGSYEWLLGNIDVAVRSGLFLLGAFLVIVMLLALEVVIRRLLHMET